jgi:hypothetical protein
MKATLTWQQCPRNGLMFEPEPKSRNLEYALLLEKGLQD